MQELSIQDVEPVSGGVIINPVTIAIAALIFSVTNTGIGIYNVSRKP
ncbi:hypothetical protein [Chitinimonas sp. BJB300]|nr:hypothetical protein [Chitinimonas sp. BJB300]